VTEKKQFPRLAVIIGIGCVGILCIGVLVAGGGAAFFLTQRTASSSGPEAVATVEVKVVTVMPEPTDIPPLEPTPAIEPAAPGTSLTGDQHVDDHSLYDDFSSDALGWLVYNDNMINIQYEDEAYSFQITEPDSFDWTYFPVDFIPYEIRFDVQGPEGPQDGTFGVFCHLHDVDNYYFVEFDLFDNTYLIGLFLDGEFLPLTEENSSGEFWQGAEVLNSPPTEVNHIGVSCYLEEITLFINDQLVDQVNVEQPFDQPGEAAFFVYTFDFAGPEGYKMLFDNVEVWQPVQ